MAATRAYKRVPFISQTEIAECGLACLSMIASAHGQIVDLSTLRQRFNCSTRGTTVRDLVQIAGDLGFACKVLRLELLQLSSLRLPAILHWSFNHFVVLESFSRKGAIILDPSQSRRLVNSSELNQNFTGIAVEISPIIDIRNTVPKSQSIRSRDLWPRHLNLGLDVTKIIALSFLIQVSVLLVPLSLASAMECFQVSIAAYSGMICLLIFLSIGVVAHTARFVRGLLMLRIAPIIAMEVMQSIMHRLLSIDMRWFAKRTIGDVIDRISSTSYIHKFILGEGLVCAVDFAVIFVALAFGAWVNILLSVVIFFSLSLKTLVYLLFSPLIEQQILDQTVRQARQNTILIDIVRTIRSLKLANCEHGRVASWLLSYTKLIRSENALNSTNLTIEYLDNLLGALTLSGILGSAFFQKDGVQNTAVTSFSFIVLYQILSTSFDRILRAYLAYKNMRVHLDRLADVLYAEAEENAQGWEPADDHKFLGKVTIRDVRFGYSNLEPEIICGINLEIQAGEFVAITGASGSGKSSLLKLLLRMEKPTTGVILFDHSDIGLMSKATFALRVSAVLQDDTLLTGTIRDNISLFDPQPDGERLRRAAEMACIHDDIASMPMKYNTFVSESSAHMSGGQKQRIILARALYKNPSVLIVDEPTSNLDVDTERRINGNIAGLRITRIMVAHRPESIDAADRVIRIEAGRLVSDLKKPSSCDFEAKRAGRRYPYR